MDDFYKAKVLGLLVSNLRRRAEKLGWGWPDPTNAMEELAELLMLTGGVLGPSGASLNYAELAQEPQADSFLSRSCGAESVPKKNFGLPEMAAFSRAL